MQDRKRTDAEMALIAYILASPMTNSEYVFKHCISEKHSELLEFFLLEVLYPTMVNKTSSVISLLVDCIDNWTTSKHYSGEEFFKILNTWKSNNSNECLIEKRIVGKLAKLTEKITEEDFINNNQIAKKYYNVIKREHPELKNSENIKLIFEITKDPLTELKETEGRILGGAILKELAPDIVYKNRSKFSYRKLVSSNKTLEFLINNKSYLESLTKVDNSLHWSYSANYSGEDAYFKEFIYALIKQYTTGPINTNTARSVIVSLGVSNVINEILLSYSKESTNSPYGYEFDTTALAPLFNQAKLSTNVRYISSRNVSDLSKLIQNIKFILDLNLLDELADEGEDITNVKSNLLTLYLKLVKEEENEYSRWTNRQPIESDIFFIQQPDILKTFSTIYSIDRKRKD